MNKRLRPLMVKATKPLTIRVIDKDVRFGKSKDHTKCAMSQACMRAGMHRVWTTKSRFYAQRIEGGPIEVFDVPSNLKTEIISFDRSRVFSPGEYTLKVPRTSGPSTARTGAKVRKRAYAKRIAIPGVRPRIKASDFI